ncbi:MAG: hypothetical protein Ct9H300mP12_05030 [Acidimicrobiales bacterium]|nr:MAG: hypothetical protein Ct9H300mP12_05030 [Acidimicrobiales bacterium]
MVDGTRVIGPVEAALRARRDSGGKCLVVYVTGGLGADWLETARAVAAAGADVIEIGVPFSDPVMDGPTIQAANDVALDGGATPLGILDALREGDVGVPLAVMTYYNIAYRMGLERFAESLMAAGVSGCILPDLPLEEAGPWLDVAAVAGVEPILLAAPTAPEERLPRICEHPGVCVRGWPFGSDRRRSELAQCRGDCHPFEAGHRSTSTGRRGGWDTGTGPSRLPGTGTAWWSVQRSSSGWWISGPEGVAELVAEFRVALDA